MGLCLNALARSGSVALDHRVQYPARHPGGQDGFALIDGPHRFDDLVGAAFAFDQAAPSALPEGFQCQELLVIARAQHDGLDVRMLRADARHSPHVIRAQGVYAEQDHVGLQFMRQLDGRLPVFRLAYGDHIICAFDQTARCLAGEVVFVCDQRSD
jgi:hypothetical protein